MSRLILIIAIVVIVIVAVYFFILKRTPQRAPGEKASNQKKFYKTLASAVLLGLLLAQPHAGFMILFFAIPLLIWLVYSIYVVLTRPDVRKWQLARMAVWIVSFTVILAAHEELKKTTRHNADDIVAAINKYKSAQDAYPENIEMTGISRDQLVEKLGRPSAYYFAKGTPNLYYGDTFIIFQTYFYDFEKNTWVHHGD